MRAIFLFLALFMLAASAAEACRSVQLIQAELQQKALAAAGRDSTTLYSKKVLTFHYVQPKSAPRTNCPEFYEAEFAFTFQDGCQMQVKVNTNPQDPGETTMACARNDSVMPQTPTQTSPVAEMKRICVSQDAGGNVTRAECPGFTGAEFFCPDGMSMTEVPAEVFPQQCGPYR